MHRQTRTVDARATAGTESTVLVLDVKQAAARARAATHAATRTMESVTMEARVVQHIAAVAPMPQIALAEGLLPTARLMHRQTRTVDARAIVGTKSTVLATAAKLPPLPAPPTRRQTRTVDAHATAGTE